MHPVDGRHIDVLTEGRIIAWAFLCDCLCLVIDLSRGRERVTRTQSAYSSCTGLRKMLAEGWEIEPPVYIRPHWQSNSRWKNSSVYHFVLWRRNQVNLVSIPDSPEIAQFLIEHGLTVDRL